MVRKMHMITVCLLKRMTIATRSVYFSVVGLLFLAML